MLGKLLEAFLLGLSMGPVCLSYCAPVFVPVVVARKETGWGAASRIVGLFLLGRLAGYSLIGILAGLVGASLHRDASSRIWGLIQVAMGILVILYGVMTDAAGKRWCIWMERTGAVSSFPAVLGLLTGLNLCPPFGAAIAGAAATVSVRDAVIYFWAFFAGTAAYFVPFTFLSPLTGKESFRQVARVCLFLAGIWLIAEGIIGIWRR